MSLQGLSSNGWAIYAHPLFLNQLAALIAQVDGLRQKNPTGYLQKNASKRLAAINRLAFEIIPQDPTRAEYRQGDTLGSAHKHWFRAKFFQQYRLFFRYHLESRVIVYAWRSDQTRDDDTKRAYESANDAYRVFRKMIESGHPPDDWQTLLNEAQAQGGQLRELAG
jgi:toxin YhaV